MKNESDPTIQKCVDDCNRCYQTCVRTFTHCLQLGGKHADVEHLTILKDCAAMCKVSEGFMLRHSSHMQCLCDECAKICKECAESCERIDPDDAMMKECVEACRECAKACTVMS